MPVHIHARLTHAGKHAAAAAATTRASLGSISLQSMGGAVGGVSDAVARMIYSEMFDRFPKLKIVLAETGVGWLPHFLEHMDDHWWRNRVWTGFEARDAAVALFRAQFHVHLHPRAVRRAEPPLRSVSTT